MPINKSWRTPYSVLMKSGEITWHVIADNLVHLIIIGPKEVYQGWMTGKPKKWDKAGREELWKKSYSM